MTNLGASIGQIGETPPFSLWPPSASTGAADVDHVYMGLLGLTLFFVVLIGALTLGYGVKYRAGAEPHRTGPIRRRLQLEVAWVAAPLLLTAAIFAWGAWVFVEMNTPPADARTIYVVGRQWMWKVQHPGGRREINELHVPAGEPIRLVLTSQDVIHSFFVPAFRVKRDAVPGSYSSLWFQANAVGEYHLFCAEYCGAEHARMRGRVVIMPPAEFQRWLAAGDGTTAAQEAPGGARAAGRGDSPDILRRFGCLDCHTSAADAPAPALTGLFGRTVGLSDGRSVTADENYIRQSILDPNDRVPQGYDSPSTMPAYAGQITEEEMIQLVETIKALPRPDENREGGS